MNKNFLLAVGITILFLGVSVQPSIAIIQPEEKIEVEYFEITSEICGLPGKNHTIQLTTEEAENIEVLFESIRERLNETKSREKSEEIFKETIIELNKYDLLGDLNVKQAQRLVTIGYWNPRIIKLLEKIFSRPEENPDEIENMFCLLVGDTNHRASSQGPLARIGAKIYSAVQNLLNSTLIKLLDYPVYLYENGLIGPVLYELFRIILLPITLITIPIMILMVLFVFYYWWNDIIYASFPLNIGTLVGFGGNYSSEDGFVFLPAEGWIYTFGMNGYKNWSGEFYGRLPIPSPSFLCYPGASGFTGIKLSYRSIDTGEFRYFLIGSAYRFKIGSEPLED